MGLNMKSFRAYLATAIVALFAVTFVSLAPAFAVDIPDDDDQDILIRNTLMTFNDANLSGNYSVFMAKASKEFQAQFTAEKMASAFGSFSKNKVDLGMLSPRTTIPTRRPGSMATRWCWSACSRPMILK